MNVKILVAAFFISYTAVAGADLNAVPAAPEVPARSYLLVDFDTGQVLAEKDANTRIEPASLTKIMTVYTVAHALREGHIRLTDSTVVSEYAWKQEGSRMFLDVNRPVTVDELLHGDIIQSGNDASVALAEHVSGTEEAFAVQMNAHAKALGMQDTHYVNSTGLPNPGHYTTPHDLALLAAALIRDFPDIYKYFSIPDYTYNGIHQPNRNGLLGKDPSVDGIKTGHTDSAGYCLVGSARREDMRLISVVMGTDSNGARTRASQALLKYGFQFYESKRLYAANSKVADARVWYGAQETVKVGPGPGGASVVFPRGQYTKLKANVDLPAQLEAPIKAGQVLGQVHIELNGRGIASIPLLALEEVAAGSMVSQLIDRVRLMIQ